MELNLDLPGPHLFIRRLDAAGITVIDRELRHSFVLGLDRVIEPWPAQHADELMPAHAEPLLALAPEVVLLGTGQQQRFPPIPFLACFIERGIGVEVMNNTAAARTHGLLAGEGRRVAAAFLLPGV